MDEINRDLELNAQLQGAKIERLKTQIEMTQTIAQVADPGKLDRVEEKLMQEIEKLKGKLEEQRPLVAPEQNLNDEAAVNPNLNEINKRLDVLDAKHSSEQDFGAKLKTLDAQVQKLADEGKDESTK